MLKIAVGPGGNEPRFVDWTETIMKAYQQHSWSWDFEGLSMHNYTIVDWQHKFASFGFGNPSTLAFSRRIWRWMA